MDGEGAGWIRMQKNLKTRLNSPQAAFPVPTFLGINQTATTKYLDSVERAYDTHTLSSSSLTSGQGWGRGALPSVRCERNASPQPSPFPKSLCISSSTHQPMISILGGSNYLSHLREEPFGSVWNALHTHTQVRSPVKCTEYKVTRVSVWGGETFAPLLHTNKHSTTWRRACLSLSACVKEWEMPTNTRCRKERMHWISGYLPDQYHPTRPTLWWQVRVYQQTSLWWSMQVFCQAPARMVVRSTTNDWSRF